MGTVYPRHSQRHLRCFLAAARLTLLISGRSLKGCHSHFTHMRKISQKSCLPLLRSFSFCL